MHELSDHADSRTRPAQILQYIADHDGVDRAHDQLVEAFELLDASPAAGQLREDLTGTTIRWWIVFKFVVIYEAARSPVEILRVLHGMRDVGALF